MFEYKNMLNADDFIEERQPKRAKWNSWVASLLFLGIICIFTIVAGLLSIFVAGLLSFLFFLIAGIIAWIRNSRYPVIKVTCPDCSRVLKVEPEVTQFTCPRCYRPLRKVGDVWEINIISNSGIENNNVNIRTIKYIVNDRIYINERQPKRVEWNFWVVGIAGLGFLCMMTIVGILIAPYFFLIAGIIARIRDSRYPLINVTCPNCIRVLKAEPEVTKFTCPLCHSTLRKSEMFGKKDIPNIYFF